MEKQPIKLYETDKTVLPTNQGAHYYGRADGYVYVLYAVPYKTNLGRIKLQYCIGRLIEYSFDYEKKKVFKGEKELRLGFSGYPQLDEPDVKIKIIDTNKRVQFNFHEQFERWFKTNKKLP